MQAVGLQFGTVHGAAGKVSRRSDGTLARRHRLQWFIHPRAHGPRKGDEHSAYTPLWGVGLWHTLHFTFNLCWEYDTVESDIPIRRNFWRLVAHNMHWLVCPLNCNFIQLTFCTLFHHCLYDCCCYESTTCKTGTVFRECRNAIRNTAGLNAVHCDTKNHAYSLPGNYSAKRLAYALPAWGPFFSVDLKLTYLLTYWYALYSLNYRAA